MKWWSGEIHRFSDVGDVGIGRLGCGQILNGSFPCKRWRGYAARGLDGVAGTGAESLTLNAAFLKALFEFLAELHQFSGLKDSGRYFFLIIAKLPYLLLITHHDHLQRTAEAT